MWRVPASFDSRTYDLTCILTSLVILVVGVAKKIPTAALAGVASLALRCLRWSDRVHPWLGRLFLVDLAFALLFGTHTVLTMDWVYWMPAVVLFALAWSVQEPRASCGVHVAAHVTTCLGLFLCQKQ